MSKNVVNLKLGSEVNGKSGNSTPCGLATPEPLNRSSHKVAHVITSWISTDTQNLVTIPQGDSFPVCAKLRIKMFTRLLFGVLPTAYSLDT